MTSHQGSCAANMGISWKHYPSIWGSGAIVGCLYVAQEMTDVNGRAVFDLPAGDYLAIGEFIEGPEPKHFIRGYLWALLPERLLYINSSRLL